MDHTPEEKRAHEAILKAMASIQAMGLEYNVTEMVFHIHGLQHIVGQHVLHRIKPEFYGDWYTKENYAKLS